MILGIEKIGSEKLRIKATPVPFVTDELRALAEDMLETMYKAKGVGLAAEQVGRTEALFVIDVPESCEDDDETRAFNAKVRQPLVCFNPQILSKSGEQDGREGCLSVPNCGADVKRAAEVTMQYVDAAGVPQIAVARGFLARAMQHERDHLDGVLYVDLLDEKTREKVLAKMAKNAKKKKK
ncbi:MAG: peptide deformylase [Kiritimatiellae bacterium]|nr:peptide deformylase [Kiritimatiellia bacterium]